MRKATSNTREKASHPPNGSEPGSPVEPRNAAGVLAALARASMRRGDAVAARTQLVECLALVASAGAGCSAAAALETVAGLAAALGQTEQAAEFLGACERIERRSGERPRDSRERREAVRRLRSQLGSERFDAACAASRATPLPFEFYVSAARRWLEGLDPSRLLERPSAGLGPSAEPATPRRWEAGTTVELVALARGGSAWARERLTERHLGALRRFAHGRLPARARGLMDTNDLVQVTLIRALERLRALRPTRKGDFLAYLRRILTNRVRDEIRRSTRAQQAPVPLEDLPSAGPSPLDDAIERDALESYREAVSRLSGRQRQALVLRLEHGLSYQEVADAIGSPSSNAARMIVSRALTQVTRSLNRSARRRGSAAMAGQDDAAGPGGPG